MTTSLLAADMLTKTSTGEAVQFWVLGAIALVVFVVTAVRYSAL